MIQLKPNGYNIILLTSILLVISSCSPLRKIKKFNRAEKDYNIYFINDSLDLSYRFAADYREISKSRNIKKRLNKYDLNLNRTSCLAYYKTDLSPYLEFGLFYIPKDANTAFFSNSVEEQLIENGFIIDSLRNNVIIKQIIPDLGFIYLVGHSEKRDFINLKGEFIDDENHFIVGNDYLQSCSKKSPYTLAYEASCTADTTMNYLAPLVVLRENKENYSSFQEKGTYAQAEGTYWSFITNADVEHKELLDSWRNHSYLYKEDYLNIPSSRNNEDALDYIVEKCSTQSVVMINENHFNINHRLFVNLLLRKLYDLGFRYLGLEALSPNDTAIMARTFPLYNSGFYTREPMMSNLISDAIELGFAVFGYDKTEGNRELNQARNIFNNTIAHDSDSKVLIVAGFGHIHEQSNEEKKMMAEQFHKEYGINPFTIEQTEFISNIKDNWISIIATNNTALKKMEVDMRISNNIDYSRFTTYLGYTSCIFKIPQKCVKNNEEYLMSIYNNSHYEKDKKATPVYNYIIEKDNKEKIVNIKLKKGKYIAVIRDKDNIIINTQTQNN